MATELNPGATRTIRLHSCQDIRDTKLLALEVGDDADSRDTGRRRVLVTTGDKETRHDRERDAKSDSYSAEYTGCLKTCRHGPCLHLRSVSASSVACLPVPLPPDGISVSGH